MAALDIMPWISPLGGTYEARWGQMTASEEFDIGEPVMVVTAGTLTEPTDDAAQWVITEFTGGTSAIHGGIACFGPGAAAGSANINWKTGNEFTALDDIAYWPFNQGILFKTSNFFAAGAGSAVAPVQTDVGESYQITYGTTSPIGWGVEQTAGVPGVDVCAGIIEVLDSTGDPIRITGNAGTQVVFEITAGLPAA